MRRWLIRFLLCSLCLLPLGSRAETPNPVHRLIVQPDDGRAALLSALQAATNAIDLTIYSNGVTACVGTFLYIHAKMVLADYGTDAAQVFLGSENFSRTSLNRNRELGILLREPDLLDRLHAVFEQDWAKVHAPAAAQPEAVAK